MADQEGVLTCLVEARARVAKGWCQGAFAQDEGGRGLNYLDPRAVRWSAWGAMRGQNDDEAREVLKRHGAFDSLSVWNDTPGRTQAEVLAVFDKAIASLQSAPAPAPAAPATAPPPPDPTAPIALCRSDKPAVVIAHACPDCGTVCGSVKQHGSVEASAEAARRHCAPVCRCGQPAGKGRIECAPCERARIDGIEQGRRDRALKVCADDWEKPVVYNDRYYHSVEELYEHLADEDDVDWPVLAWGCEEEGLSFDAEDIASQIPTFEEGDVDGPSKEALAELQAMVDAWIERQGIRWFEERRQVLVVLDKPEDWGNG